MSQYRTLVPIFDELPGERVIVCPYHLEDARISETQPPLPCQAGAACITQPADHQGRALSHC
jgi:hypothetical protein